MPPKNGLCLLLPIFVAYDPAVFKDDFVLFFSPLPLGGPREGPDCYSLQKIGGLGPIPAGSGGKATFHLNFGLKRSWDDFLKQGCMFVDVVCSSKGLLRKSLF